MVSWLANDCMFLPLPLVTAMNAAERPHPFPPLSTGRDICTLCRLWLI
jgi:hypothetical protein